MSSKNQNIIFTVEQENIGSLSFLDVRICRKISKNFQIRKKLKKLFSDKLTSCNLKNCFYVTRQSQNFYAFTDKLPKMLHSGLVYEYKCGGCNATYYGKTKHHFKVRICEHLGISHLTGKKGKD